MMASHTFYDDQRPPVRDRNRTSEGSSNKMQRLQPRSRQPPTCPEETCTNPHYTHPTVNSTARKRASKPLPPSDSSLPSSRLRFHQPLASHIYCSDVAATDPEHIAQLWQSVMTYDNDTESSRGKRGNKKRTPSATETLTSASTSTSRRRQQQTSTTPTSLGIRAKNEPAAKVNDLDFETSVLAPHGITIEKQSLTNSFYDHFRFSGLPKDRTERLNAYKKVLPLHLWLEPDTERKERIQQEYCAMNTYGCNEAEYSAYALHDILLDERRIPALLETSDERWLPVRMLQLIQKPSPNQWEKPPRIASSEKSYEWDIRPDCAYYISLQAFPLVFRDNVKKYVSVVQKRAFSPYLTIEFKKNDEAATTAQNQVAVASAIALYNRWRLKRAALRVKNEDNNWSEEQKLQMQHYGITFVGSTWELWYTMPKTYDDWTGCTMFSMHCGDCSKLDSVGLLLSSVNDLHYWGLMVHGKSCQADIDTIVRGKASRPSWLPKSDKELGDRVV
ncbi:hypothetical protein F4824DRAFT_74929 [Ustulina deusta]|nr:hypothetical protein F4824DRAFT_74929 [Ustulina deusta]